MASGPARCGGRAHSVFAFHSQGMLQLMHMGVSFCHIAIGKMRVLAIESSAATLCAGVSPHA